MPLEGSAKIQLQTYLFLVSIVKHVHHLQQSISFTEMIEKSMNEFHQVKMRYFFTVKYLPAMSQ